MKSYRYIFFDLDGTLTDPGMGITNSVLYALKKFGIEEERSKVYCFIGPPLLDSFRKYYGFSPEGAREAVVAYREYYSVTGILENAVYEGIEALLADLQKAGKILVLATSKPEVFARQILEHFGLAKYFTVIAGATMSETRTQKDEVIRYAMELCGLSEGEEIVMIGDRKYDILGARACGVDSIGVTFGYGSREELEATAPIALAEDVAELRKILLPEGVVF